MAREVYRGAFLVGVNYWPRAKAMYWWHRFDTNEVRADFGRLAEYGLGLVRIFLLWEVFQPVPNRISPEALKNLMVVADLASEFGLSLMPTLFCGHMSGVNWIPEWALAEESSPQRFPVFTGEKLHYRKLRNPYVDESIMDAQELLCKEIARAMCGHPALFAYDLGNEASNCFIPPDGQAGRSWLERMAGTLKTYGEGCKVTFGMHAEDLEEDRLVGPAEAATVCDFLCMHGYPFYLKWVDDPLDYEVLPFLGAITEWLGGKPVLFQEFGIPTRPSIPPFLNTDDSIKLHGRLWSEDEGAAYYSNALIRLKEEGMMGAMAWCYGDYTPELWNYPPLLELPHERFFGLFRHDGTAKPIAEAIRRFVRTESSETVISVSSDQRPWLKNEKPEAFYQDPVGNLKRLFARYKAWMRSRQPSVDPRL